MNFRDRLLVGKSTKSTESGLLLVFFSLFSAEQTLHKLPALHLQMARNLAQDSGQGADPEGCVSGDGN